jgi:MerR family transcriptional regulator/heat shock protein HspR
MSQPTPPPVVPREQVARQLTVSTTLLVRYEARGLVHPVRAGDVEGYDPAELRRLWTIVSLQRDLGVNLAGVEAILRLRTHVDDLHRRLFALADELREALAGEADADARP